MIAVNPFLAPVTAYVYAAVAVGLYLACRVIADGRRQRVADRRHPLRALGRCVERSERIRCEGL